MRRAIAAGIFAFTLAGCEGPTGPGGPAGPEGAPGPGEWVYYDGRLNSSGAAIVSGVPGTEEELPVIQCYTRGSPTAYWDVAQTCGVSGGEPGTVQVFVVGPSNGYYQIVVVHQ